LFVVIGGGCFEKAVNFSFVDSVLDVNVRLMFQSSQCVSCGVLCAVRVNKRHSVGTKQKVQNCP